MNIGIYGGTFDPPHRGHIAAAKAAVSALHLDRLLLIPDAVPPHKALPEGSPTAQQRCDMAVLAPAELGCPTFLLPYGEGGCRFPGARQEML